MRVLVIEDDSPTAKTIQMHLNAEGFVCDTTGIGEDGLEIAKRYDYDLIILDLMLPDIDGYEILRRLRTIQIPTPVLILSGLSDIDDKIKGLGFGADDYLTKPFNKDELIARVRAIIRRAKGHSNSTIQVGSLTVNLTTKMVEANGKPIRLTGREYAILELLAVRKGSTLSKEVFLNHLYGGMEEPEFKIIDVFVCKLRKKLSDALNGENYIETIWGRGYVLREPMEEETTSEDLERTGEEEAPSSLKEEETPSKGGDSPTGRNQIAS
ncbi:MAG: response regulator transcription factor [bacterium]|nr:response regulator transcription factor [bacterium]